LSLSLRYLLPTIVVNVQRHFALLSGSLNHDVFRYFFRGRLLCLFFSSPSPPWIASCLFPCAFGCTVVKTKPPPPLCFLSGFPFSSLREYPPPSKFWFFCSRINLTRDFFVSRPKTGSQGQPLSYQVDLFFSPSDRSACLLRSLGTKKFPSSYSPPIDRFRRPLPPCQPPLPDGFAVIAKFNLFHSSSDLFCWFFRQLLLRWFCQFFFSQLSFFFRLIGGFFFFPQKGTSFFSPTPRRASGSL